MTAQLTRPGLQLPKLRLPRACGSNLRAGKHTWGAEGTAVRRQSHPRTSSPGAQGPTSKGQKAPPLGPSWTCTWLASSRSVVWLEYLGTLPPWM